MNGYSRQPLVNILSRVHEPVAIDPYTTYKQVTIRLFHKGVVLRGEKLGSAIRTSRQWLVRHGQILLSRIDARNGAIGIVPLGLNGAVVTNDFWAFDVNTALAEPAFLDAYFGTSEFVEACNAASEGTTNRVRLQPDRFVRIEVPLPPLDEQRRIISQVDQLAAKIAEARQLKREAAREAAAILVSAWHEIFRLPNANGWRNVSVEDCCEAMIDYRGRTPPLAETGIPHLTSRNIKSGRIDWNTNKFVSEETYEKYMTRGTPKPGDVIFTMEAPLGEAAVVPDQRRFSLAQRTLLLRSRSDVVGGRFLARVIMSPQVREVIYSKATGTTVKGIASKRLKQIPLPIPPLDLQRRIVAYLDELQAKVESLKKLQSETTAELNALVPSILAKAFRGEL